MTHRILLFALLALPLHAQELIHIPCCDGDSLHGRLSLPASGTVETLVIDVPSSGPHTYLDMRRVGRSTRFTYHDFFMNEFARRGIAYFSYSTRYTRPDSTAPPDFDRVDRERFVTCTPMMKVEDLETVVAHLTHDPRLSACRVALLGFSEGGIIASLAAERARVRIDALFLAGTPMKDLEATIDWQLGGGSSMVTFRRFVDANGDGIIQRAEYVQADARAVARLGGRSFDELDRNADSVLTAEDFRITLQPQRERLAKAVEENDNDWLWTSFFRIGAAWIHGHREIEATAPRLLRLTIPVHLYHGTVDASCPVEDVTAFAGQASAAHRTNIHVATFPDHDHSLEFLAWVVRKEMPAGLKALFDDIERLR